MRYCTLLLLGQLMLASASHASTFDLSCANVQSIRVYSISRDWSIDVRMNDAGATALRDVTRRNLHHEMTVLAGGEELVREVVHAALEHGVLLFWEPTREEALRKVARICPERLVPQAESARPYPLEHPERVDSPMFDIGCDMVASMHLLRDRDFHWRDRSLDGFVYRVHLVLHAPIGRALARFQEQQPERVLDAGASAVSVKHVQLSAHGQRIRSEAPAWDTMDDQGNVILTWRTLPAAMAAARSICAEKAPATMRVPRTFGVEDVPLPGEE